MTYILICIWPNWYHLLAIAALSDSFQLICLIPKKKPSVVFCFCFSKRKKRKASLLPNCFSPLISLKTVNEQRERKVGELLWLSNDFDSVGFVRSQAVLRPYLSLWLQRLRRFALLCSILSFAGPQRNCVFAFYICFVQMSVKLFSMWAWSYQGLYAHFINRQKKCPSCMHTAGSGVYFILH